MKFFRFLMPLLALCLSTGCGRMLFDDEVSENCDPRYLVRFVYDWNLKWANAFPAEVNAVTLHVVDHATGRIVWSVTESGERLRRDGYEIEVPVAPGDYDLLAWCGDGHIDHGDSPAHFSVARGEHHTQLNCTLQTESDPDGTMHSRRPLDSLYHGHVSGQTFPEDYGTYVYTVPLVKDTNEVNVVLQHLYGKDLSPSDYHFSLTDDNSRMDWDNSLIPSGTVTYHAHDVRSGTAGVVMPDESSRPAASRSVTSVNAVVASMSTSRMVKGQDMRLQIHHAETGDELVNVPVIDYFLLVKGYNHRNLDDQEYLDRQDKYDMVFFLDETAQWTEITLVIANIKVNSWRIVKQPIVIS